VSNSRLWKFPLLLIAYQEVGMPTGARPLYVAMQGDQAVLYAHVDPGQAAVMRAVWIHGTGHHTRFSGRAEPVGLLILEGGALMFHVFVEPEGTLP
jgi:hypothetical protein